MNLNSSAPHVVVPSHRRRRQTFQSDCRATGYALFLTLLVEAYVRHGGYVDTTPAVNGFSQSYLLHSLGDASPAGDVAATSVCWTSGSRPNQRNNLSKTCKWSRAAM